MKTINFIILFSISFLANAQNPYGNESWLKSDKYIISFAEGKAYNIEKIQSNYIEIGLNIYPSKNEVGTIIIQDIPFNQSAIKTRYEKYIIYSIEGQADGSKKYWTFDTIHSEARILFHVFPNSLSPSIVMSRYTNSTQQLPVKVIKYILIWTACTLYIMYNQLLYERIMALRKSILYLNLILWHH